MLPSLAISLDLGGHFFFVTPVGGKIFRKAETRISARIDRLEHVSFSCALCSIFGIAVAVMIIIVARAGPSNR